MSCACRQDCACRVDNERLAHAVKLLVDADEQVREAQRNREAAMLAARSVMRLRIAQQEAGDEG